MGYYQSRLFVLDDVDAMLRIAEGPPDMFDIMFGMPQLKAGLRKGEELLRETAEIKRRHYFQRGKNPASIADAGYDNCFRAAGKSTHDGMS